MSRLDRHVNAVRAKMLLGALLKSLAWTLMVFAAVVLLNILVDRFLTRRLPHWVAFFWAGAGVSVAAAVAYSFWRRPTARQAAVAIDEKLGLKEKFSTALYVRPLNDPFAAAAVRDAEMTADNVSLHKRFPVQFPRMMYGTIMAIVVALFAGRFLDPHPLFANDDSPTKKPPVNAEKMTPENKKLIAQAVEMIDSTPTLTAEDKAKVEAAKHNLDDLTHRPTHDPVLEQRSALKAMQDMTAIKDKVKEVKDKAVEAKNETELFRSADRSFDETGPLGDVSKELAKGNFNEAAEKLGNIVDKFDKLKPEDQEKAAEQMKQLEKQLEQIAKDPKAQQQIANQLMKNGATQQQLQQLANAAQAAANGDKQAQQQMNQVANQIAQAANQQQAGATPQQQQQTNQQVQNLVKQMQGTANAQQAAKGMAGAAGALAKQMAAQASAQKGGAQQQSPGQSGGNSKAGQSGGTAQQSASASGQSGKSAAGSGGQPQAGAQPSGGNQPGGNQPGGQQAGGQGGQTMADAKAEMQKQLRDLQDAADQASQGDGQMADAQQGGDQGQGNDGQGNGEQSGKGNNGQGNWDKGDANQKGGGSGGPGISAGGPRPKGMQTPVAFQHELAASTADEKGKFNQVRFVKAMSEKGSSKVEMSTVIEQAEKDSADEVEQDRITRSETAVVKRYFEDLKSGQAGQGAEPAGSNAAPPSK